MIGRGILVQRKRQPNVAAWIYRTLLCATLIAAGCGGDGTQAGGGDGTGGDPFPFGLPNGDDNSNAGDEAKAPPPWVQFQQDNPGTLKEDPTHPEDNPDPSDNAEDNPGIDDGTGDPPPGMVPSARLEF